MAEVESPEQIEQQPEDHTGDHPPADAEPTPEEQAEIEGAPVEEGEEETRAGVALPPLRTRMSPNRSSRRGQRIKGIVVHETEGGYLGAVGWLCRPQSGVSAHIVLKEDGSEATQLVPWSEKAWHACNANAYTLGLEMAGFGATRNLDAQVARTARICGYWCTRLEIPPVFQAKAWGGIARHRDLGPFGCNHSDPKGFDWDEFIKMVAAEVKRGGFRPRWGQS
jgi:N-acetyl-anhydromuramyl-L-alanine amidase AmpD